MYALCCAYPAPLLLPHMLGLAGMSSQQHLLLKVKWSPLPSGDVPSTSKTDWGPEPHPRKAGPQKVVEHSGSPGPRGSTCWYLWGEVLRHLKIWPSGAPLLGSTVPATSSGLRDPTPVGVLRSSSCQSPSCSGTEGHCRADPRCGHRGVWGWSYKLGLQCSVGE